VYSETAAQNYPDSELFQKLKAVLPAKRCGTTAEVRIKYGLTCMSQAGQRELR